MNANENRKVIISVVLIEINQKLTCVRCKYAYSYIMVHLP